MAKIDQTFQELCKKILTEGREYENKNRGVKRLQIPSFTLRHDFKDGFPILTNKKVPFKWIVTEALWFLKGDNDITYLNSWGVDIWNKDAYNWYSKHSTDNPKLSFEEFSKIGKGSVGRNYSVQWRDFCGVDQIKRLIEDMEKDIMSSRLKVNAWNPAEIFDTALPPCHSEFQVIGVPLTFEERKEVAIKEGFVEDQTFSHHSLDNLGIPEFGFELHWNQRSVDTFLGLPFNIASYAFIAKFLQEVTGYPALAIEGTLKCVHFYDNQYEAAKELVSRDPMKHPNCEMLMRNYNSQGVMLFDNNFNYFKWLMENSKPIDYKLQGYTSDDSIKVDMLAPKEL
jgi:thymidylate synthase